MNAGERVPQDAALDPWAETLAETERRRTLQTEAKIRADELRAERSYKLRGVFLDGLGWVALGTFIVGCILGLAWFVTHQMSAEDQRRLLKERERTTQLQACTAMEEPLERAFCLIQIGEKKQP